MVVLRQIGNDGSTRMFENSDDLPQRWMLAAQRRRLSLPRVKAARTTSILGPFLLRKVWGPNKTIFGLGLQSDCRSRVGRTCRSKEYRSVSMRGI